VFSGQEDAYALVLGHLIGIPNTDAGPVPSTYHVVEQLPDGQRLVLRQFGRFLRASQAHKVTIKRRLLGELHTRNLGVRALGCGR
jgi:hypothetical protein